MYDPFGQGLSHDWRLEEAIKRGTQRALEEVREAFRRELEQTIREPRSRPEPLDDEWYEELDFMKAAPAGRDGIIASLEEEIERLRNEIQGLQKGEIVAMKQILDLQSKMETLIKENTNLKKEISELKEAIEKLKKKRADRNPRR